MHYDPFLEESLPDADGKAARPDERGEALYEPVDHIGADQRPPVDAQMMFTVGDHVWRLVLNGNAQHATGA